MPADKVRSRFADLAAGDGLRLEGVAMPYGEHSPTFGDRLLPGAFGAVGELDVLLTLQHDRAQPLARTGGGGLVFEDGADALRLRADMPDTQRARETHLLVKAGVLAGLSVEYLPVTERIAEDGVLEVSAARLVRCSVVDTPAFPSATVEARAAAEARPRRRRRWWL